MTYLRRTYKGVESILPRFYTDHIRQSMIFAGVEMNYRDWIGFFFLYSIATGLTAAIVTYLILFIDWYYLLLIIAGVFLLFHGVSELLLVLSKRSRTVFIEKIVPDVLSLLSSNLKSGMTIDQALLLSNRAEFGKFREDLAKASKETLAGKTLGEALFQISDTIDSQLFRKTVNLIVEGINSGGELSSLLENIAGDIRGMEVLRKEIRASILMYTFILFVAAGFGAPMLFGVSLYEVETLSGLSELTTGIEIPNEISFITFQGSSLDISFLRIIIILSLAINSTFGGLMYGVLETGSAKDGVRMIPFFVALSLGVFFLSTYLVSNVFTGISLI